MTKPKAKKPVTQKAGKTGAPVKRAQPAAQKPAATRKTPASKPAAKAAKPPAKAAAAKPSPAKTAPARKPAVAAAKPVPASAPKAAPAAVAAQPAASTPAEGQAAASKPAASKPAAPAPATPTAASQTAGRATTRAPANKSALVAATLAAIGCATPWNDLRPVEAKSTPEAEHRVGSFKGKRGVALFRQSWHPIGQARGGLVIVHGLKDHSSRYDALARQLAAEGIAVFVFDLRGHGRSSGRRVAVDAFDDYVADLEAFIAEIEPDVSGPLFLFGHSMGGAIAAAYVATREHDLA